MAFQRIVVGSDGSVESSDAVALGAALARASGAGLSLVGVYSPALLPIPGMTDRETLRAQALARLRQDRDRFAPQALVHAVADTSVARALRHYAAHWHAGLLVIGSSGKAPAGHAAIGRQGRQLLYDSPFALAVAARGIHRWPTRLARIAVGWDGGPESAAALELAARLARGARAKLSVRTVVEDRLPAFSLNQPLVAEMWSELFEGERQAALERAVEAVADHRDHAEVTASVGDPGAELREVAETADLMVVGSRRWGPFARLVSGGVGETLVTDCATSVLIVPRPPRPSAGRPNAARRPGIAAARAT